MLYFVLNKIDIMLWIYDKIMDIDVEIESIFQEKLFIN